MLRRPNLVGLGQSVREGTGSDPAKHPVTDVVEFDDNIRNVPITMIDPDPNQPRSHFDKAQLAELTQSIRDHGVLQPILIRPIKDRYLIIAGERRWRAATSAGLTKIPALVRIKDDPEELALIENLQRVDLNAIEEAEGLLRLKEHRHLTDEMLARIIGKSRQSVNDSLALTRLPEAIKDECRTSGKVQKSQLLQVLRLPNYEAQMALWEALRDGNLTVREARRVAATTNSPAKPGPKPYQYKFQTADRSVSVTVKFRKSRVTAEEVRQALRAALENVT